jgi:photosystem II stability/assembly factor-like uncharacterized protein
MMARLPLTIGAVMLGGSLAAAAVAAEAPQATEWSEHAPLVTRSLLLGAAGENGSIVVVGDRGAVLMSRDQGATWRQARVPTRNMLTAVAAAGNGLWAVGHDEVILHSPDDGETWTQQHIGGENGPPLFDVLFADPQRGLAVGAYGGGLATDDGGASWESLKIDPQERHLNALARDRDGTLYIAAEYGSVFRSRDQGATWDIATTPYSGSYFGVIALRSGAVEVFGLRGHVFRSEDAGKSWRAVATGTDETLLGGAELPDGSVVIVGLGGTILVSGDGGQSFRGIAQPDRLGLASAFPIDPARVLLIGEPGIRVVGRRELEKRP